MIILVLFFVFRFVFQNSEDVSAENLTVDHNSQDPSAENLTFEVRKTRCLLFLMNVSAEIAVFQIVMDVSAEIAVFSDI